MNKFLKNSLGFGMPAIMVKERNRKRTFFDFIGNRMFWLNSMDNLLPPNCDNLSHPSLLVKFPPRFHKISGIPCSSVLGKSTQTEGNRLLAAPHIHRPKFFCLCLYHLDLELLVIWHVLIKGSTFIQQALH